MSTAPPGLAYSVESPFFAKRVEQFDGDIERMSEFLKTLVKQMRKFCAESKATAKSAEILSIHLKNGLPSKAQAQLLPIMRCFGDIFLEIASSQEILAVTTMKMLLYLFYSVNNN